MITSTVSPKSVSLQSIRPNVTNSSGNKIIALHVSPEQGNFPNGLFEDKGFV